ncbi:hypothetical protein COV16_06195 [Candidatus Woesearchaeota archaeon CG10_big_fil_rev_8_21_14_0_10_34_8]|nr:MAG: hypothetical protein COV16_06195 [Candidatus Woesearchaeota archaeon CG10_big_fil_rev_8_21_14_0_10_34_8]
MPKKKTNMKKAKRKITNHSAKLKKTKSSSRYKSYLKDKATKKRYKNVIEEYTSIAHIYDERWKKYLKATEDILLKQLKLKGRETIIDAGCGTGSLICNIQENYKYKGKIIGFDITPAMLDIAELRFTKKKKFKTNLQLELAHCENFGAKKDSVDIIICTNVFHHLPHPEHALNEFYRVLKNSGRLVLLDFCNDYPSTKLLDTVARIFHKAHHKSYSSDEMKDLLKKHKFKISSFKKWKATKLVGVMMFDARKRT